MSENTATYFNAKLTAVDCDGDPARVEVTASIGEFDGVVVETHAWGAHTLAEYNAEQLDTLIAALTTARTYLR